MPASNEDRITTEEQARLQAIAAAERPTLARRAQIILHWADGLEPGEIAEQVALTPRTVVRWLYDFQIERMDIFTSRAEERERITHDADTRPTRRSKRGQYPSIDDLCRRYAIDMPHGIHVGRLARELLTATEPLHHLEASYHQLIYRAGLLHNIGLSGGQRAHHKRGREILMSTPMSDLSDEDRTLIALTTLYHRKSWRPSRLDDEPSYSALSPELQRIAVVLSAIIRVADGLDYSQSQSTKIVELRLNPAGCVLVVDGPHASTDAPRADQKADMWRAVTGIPLRVVTLEADRERSLLMPHVTHKPPLPEIRANDPMSEAGRKIIHFHLLRMLYYEPGTHEGIDPESLHDMRVATRRMRAALKLFADFYTNPTRKRLSNGLREAARKLGELRDLDVRMGGASTYRTSLPTDHQTGLDPLFSHWATQRAQSRIDLVSYLDSDTYADFVARLLNFCQTPGKGASNHTTTISVAASGLLYALYETVRTYEPAIEQAPVETLHALRIDTKRLRYALEFFQKVLGPEAADLIAALVRLQDALGAMHDAQVAASIIESFITEQLLAESLPTRDKTIIRGYLTDQQSIADQHRQRCLPLYHEVVSAEARRSLALAVSVL